MTNIIVVTHGDFGAYLVEAAEMILGEQGEGVALVPVSPRTPVEAAAHKLSEALDRFDCEGREGTVVFTDIFGGTPTNIAVPRAQHRKNTVVISGVNLNMLLAAFSYRSKLPFDELVAKIIADGAKAICDVTALLAKTHAVKGVK
ncbi:MAG: hypothetical protein PHW69_03430 [Elusimicrobiaceae bacterium]|nr:hypothetical protein [Elusimicrobiaceae bacterium]